MTNYLALDVGAARVGLALANDIARIAQPLAALPNDGQIVQALQERIAADDVSVLIIGLPRGLDGQETDQTDYVRSFATKLSEVLDTEIVWQDEAVTSVKAEEELAARGKPFAKGDIDSLSAVYILEDYLIGALK